MTRADKSLERLRSANPLPSDHVDADELGRFLADFEERRNAMSGIKTIRRQEPAEKKPRRLAPALAFFASVFAVLGLIGAVALLWASGAQPAPPAASLANTPDPTTPVATASNPATTVVAPDELTVVMAEQEQIVFGVQDGFAVVNSDGSNLTVIPLEGGGAEPVWSPDHTRLLFTRYASQASSGDNIYTVKADGTNLVRLTDASTGIGGLMGNWSPDGQRIVFVADRDGPDEAGGIGNLDIYVMDADGANVTQLTNHPGPDLCPAWSPDGTTIAFGSPERTGSGLYLMDADGTNVRLLVANTSDEPGPSWSPDSERIVFQDDGEAGLPDLWVINVDGTGLTQLTNNPSSDAAPEWSPDGTRIVFTSDRSGNHQLWTIDADGSNPTQLTTQPEGAFFGDW